MGVEIIRIDAESDGLAEPFQFVVLQDKLRLGWFMVDDYQSAEIAHAAARALAENLKADPWVSPCKTHRATILAAGGAAAKLRTLVMDLWSGDGNLFCMSWFACFDKQHFEIALELIHSYRLVMENDLAFMALADEIMESDFQASEGA